MTFESGKLEIVWNYFQELNHNQIERFTIRPMMIQQYAQRIARLWKQEMGRTPKVYATSMVMMNYRYPRRLVDPHVDLVQADYHLFRHNDWILPLDAPVIEDIKRAASRPRPIRR